MTPEEIHQAYVQHIRDNGKVKLSKIVSEVSEHWGVPVEDILSRKRTQKYVKPRQHFMYLANLSGHTISDIGRFLSRDHTTVLHGIRRVEERLQ